MENFKDEQIQKIRVTNVIREMKIKLEAEKERHKYDIRFGRNSINCKFLFLV